MKRQPWCTEVRPSRPGVTTCLGCGWQFVSADTTRLRICGDCKHGRDDYQPRSGRVDQVAGAIQHHAGE